MEHLIELNYPIRFRLMHFGVPPEPVPPPNWGEPQPVPLGPACFLRLPLICYQKE